MFRTDENGVVQGLAGAGIGVAILPRLAVDQNDESVRITDLGPRLPQRQIGIAPAQGPLPLAGGAGVRRDRARGRGRDLRLARGLIT